MVSFCASCLIAISFVPTNYIEYLYSMLQAFHDMATHNADNGTGGLDGSLVYELDRPEVCSCLEFDSNLD